MTGRKGLYVNRAFTTRSNGLAPGESRVLLDSWWRTQPKYQVRFRWQPNSVSLWDNRCAQHYAIWDPFPQVRSGVHVSLRYSDRLAEAKVSASVGSRGDSYDNAMAESLNGTFKAEFVKLHGPWRSRGQLEIASIEWIDWYNAARLHREIGDIPPAEHEATWYRQNQAASAALTIQ